MRIGIDGHVLGKNIGGTERYVERLVALTPDLCSQHQFIVFVSRQAAGQFAGDRRPNVQFVTLAVSDPIAQRSLVLPWLARKHRLDVLQVQRIAPWAMGRCRILLTIHDLIPIKYPNAYSGIRDRLVRLLTPDSIARADLIVCPTQFVCDEIGRFYPNVTARRLPFYNGVDRGKFESRSSGADRRTLDRYGLDRPFLFSPGAVEDRKNLETIIEAIAQLDATSRPLLALCGPVRDSGYYTRLRERALELNVAGDVRHLGFVPDEDLADLYRSAIVCVAASRDEGFNLLPLEALACDAIVICSDIPVHRELYGDFATFFPPESPDLLAGAIRDLQTLRERHRAGAETRETVLDRFSWEAMAQRMASAFDELAPDGAAARGPGHSSGS